MKIGPLNWVAKLWCTAKDVLFAITGKASIQMLLIVTEDGLGHFHLENPLLQKLISLGEHA